MSSHDCSARPPVSSNASCPASGPLRSALSPLDYRASLGGDGRGSTG